MEARQAEAPDLEVQLAAAQHDAARLAAENERLMEISNSLRAERNRAARARAAPGAGRAPLVRL